MSTHQQIQGDKSCSESAWKSLVDRSISSWEKLYFRPYEDGTHRTVRERMNLAISFLQSYDSLDNFFRDAPGFLMFWFFQRRLAFLEQKVMKKWSRDNLDDFILVPALPGYVSREECFFVSHFWESPEHPDPDGKYLRLHQQELQDQEWSLIWVDWTCTPQAPRSQMEEKYFFRCLETMPSIIQRTGFIWFYPPFEARLWIVFEVAYYMLTSEQHFATFPDIEKFVGHVHEMIQDGVSPVVERYGYKCTNDQDRLILIARLELLVLLKRIHRIDLDVVRRLMENITWRNGTDRMLFATPEGTLELRQCDGVLALGNEQWSFTPFQTRN